MTEILKLMFPLSETQFKLPTLQAFATCGILQTHLHVCCLLCQKQRKGFLDRDSWQEEMVSAWSEALIYHICHYSAASSDKIFSLLKGLCSEREGVTALPASVKHFLF